jgi:hypothetical protein
MKQKRALLHQKASVKDHGKNLYDALIFLLALLLVLWYFKV